MRNFNNDSFGPPRGGRSFGGGGSRGRFGGSRDGGRGPMHDAICAECGNPCQVPFAPTNGKPVYCSNCFEKRGNGEDRSAQPRSDFGRPRFENRRNDFGGSSNYEIKDTKQLDIINGKLDQILAMLSEKNAQQE